jgi:hypothetical protein
VFRGRGFTCLLLLHCWHGENSANGTDTMGTLAEVFGNTGVSAQSRYLLPTEKHATEAGGGDSC